MQDPIAELARATAAYAEALGEVERRREKRDAVITASFAEGVPIRVIASTVGLTASRVSDVLGRPMGHPGDLGGTWQALPRVRHDMTSELRTSVPRRHGGSGHLSSRSCQRKRARTPAYAVAVSLLNSLFERKTGKRPPIVRVLVAVCALATLGALTWIVVAAAGLYDDAANTSERAAALQAVAAGVSLTATLLLLCVTAWYAVLTRGILRQSGPIVEADLRMGWLGYGSVITGPLALLAKGSPDERYSQPAFAIEVRNRGNAGVSIVRVAIESEAGFSLIMTTAVAGTAPPFKLDGHSSETVCMDFNILVSGIAAWEEVMHVPSRKLRAVVGLGSGLTVHSPWETLP